MLGTDYLKGGLEMGDGKAPCKHRYIVGYMVRMPQPFFRSLSCDTCGHPIRLSTPWRVLFIFIHFIAFVFAYHVASFVHIPFLGSTFFVSLVVFVLLDFIVVQLNRLILRYGKWIELDSK